MDPYLCESLSAYKSLNLGKEFCTMFRPRQTLEQFVINPLHPTIRQLLSGDNATPEQNNVFLTIWRGHCPLKPDERKWEDTVYDEEVSSNEEKNDHQVECAMQRDLEASIKTLNNNDTYNGLCIDVGLFKSRHRWHLNAFAVAFIALLAIILVATVVPVLTNQRDNKSSTSSALNGNFQSPPSISPSEGDIMLPQPTIVFSWEPSKKPISPQPTGGPSSNPSTIPSHPPTQSMAPTNYPRTANIISFLRNLTLSSSPSPLRFPAPKGSATLEEKALA